MTSGKDWWNKNVLRFRRNECSDWADVTSLGRSVPHTRGSNRESSVADRWQPDIRHHQAIGVGGVEISTTRYIANTDERLQVFLPNHQQSHCKHGANYPLPSARQPPSYGDCLEVERELSELLCAGLCDTMFAVISTLIWAVLTGQADWVCHIETLTLCIEAVA